MPRCRSWACVNRYISALVSRTANLRASHAALAARVEKAETRAANLEEALEWYTSCQEIGGKATWLKTTEGQIVVECTVNQGGTLTRYRNGRVVS